MGLLSSISSPSHASSGCSSMAYYRPGYYGSLGQCSCMSVSVSESRGAALGTLEGDWAFFFVGDAPIWYQLSPYSSQIAFISCTKMGQHRFLKILQSNKPNQQPAFSYSADSADLLFICRHTLTAANSSSPMTGLIASWSMAMMLAREPKLSGPRLLSELQTVNMVCETITSVANSTLPRQITYLQEQQPSLSSCLTCCCARPSYCCPDPKPGSSCTA